MMVALAIQPPSHIVCSPYRPPRCSNAFTSVVICGAECQLNTPWSDDYGMGKLELCI
jgi:hypothetical protein